MMNSKEYYKITFLDDMYYNTIKHIYIDSTKVSSYKDVVDDILELVKQNKNFLIKDFYFLSKNIYDNFCLSFDDKYDIEFNYNFENDIKYRIIVIFSNETKSVNISVYNEKRTNVLLYYKEYILKEIRGNCIDRFINLHILPKIHKIENFINSINSNSISRNSNNDYFSSLVYEDDFMQISTIRDEAKRIYEMCNKQLELMSEKYSKL